ncbi:MAG: ABC transporter substrate-binding protein [Clostridia bacterium]|nr:ABC transporter substrate-binding protein [Clostridia bacterium]
MSAENIAKLSVIAPVVPIKSETTDYAERLNYLGELFDIETKATDAINSINNAIASAKAKYNSLNIADKEVNVFSYYNGLEILIGNYYFFNTILYNQLCVRVPQPVQDVFDEGGFFFSISNEFLPDYCGDYIYLLMDAIPSDLAENEVWQSLEAVQAGRVGLLDMMLYVSADAIYIETQYTYLVNALELAFAD